ncbi:MAG: DUF3417 domain-containing protein, partial [Pseudomonadota bacterium]
YTSKFYAPAAAQWRKYAGEDFSGAQHVAAWKEKIRAAWPGVFIRRVDKPLNRIRYGNALNFEVAVQLNGLAAEDITVELVFTRPGERSPARSKRYALRHERALDRGEHLFVRELTLDQCGKIDYRIRAFPQHELLTHTFEMGMTVWL